MKIEKVTPSCFNKARENAEDVLTRKLTNEEHMILMIGLQYGKLEGYNEGGQNMRETIKRVLNGVSDKS